MEVTPLQLSNGVRSTATEYGGVVLTKRRYYRLNGTAFTILQLAISGASEEEIARALSSNFARGDTVTETDIRTHLTATLRYFLDEGIVVGK